MGYPYDGLDLRKHPQAYRIGRGEQGAFHAEPYKSELLTLWAFKNEEAARASAGAIYARFLEYREEEDFVGMDVARKFLQMGWTRSRRYVKYRGGKKKRAPQGARRAEGASRRGLLRKMARRRRGRGVPAPQRGAQAPQRMIGAGIK